MTLLTGDIFFDPAHGAYTPNGRIGDAPPVCSITPCQGTAVTVWTVDGEPAPLCKAHADELCVQYVRETPPGQAVGLALYLTAEKGSIGRYFLTSWSGAVVLEAYDVVKRRVGFGGSRVYFRANLPGAPCGGPKFYGTTSGVNMLARVRRVNALQ